MSTSRPNDMRDLITRSTKTFVFFFVVAAIAMAVTTVVAWLASLLGADYWARLAYVIGSGSPGSIYVLGSTWLVVAALFLSFPNAVQSVFRYATNTLIDLWFSVLGALSGAAVVIGIALQDYRALIWCGIFVAFSYFAIYAVHRWLNPTDFSFPQRLGLSALLLLFIPIFIIIA